jgi:hypothetical protein
MKISTALLRTTFLALLACLSLHVQAGEKVAYQNWVVDMSGATTEAYTANDSQSSFGVFCAADKCLFYLHQALQCQPNAKYSVLMNSATISTAITMQCTQIGNNLFQILDPFDAVLNAIKAGDTIGFAVALQSGAFGVARFSLAGSTDAIKRALVEAAKASQHPTQPNQIVPPPANSPGMRGLKDILI